MTTADRKMLNLAADLTREERDAERKAAAKPAVEARRAAVRADLPVTAPCAEPGCSAICSPRYGRIICQDHTRAPRDRT